MNSEGLIFNLSTTFGALLGYALHVSLSWREWAKLSSNAKLPFKEFLRSDLPSQIAGALSVLATYLSLPLIGQLPWVEAAIGFKPQMNFLSAVVIAFMSQAIAIKLRNIARKISDDDDQQSGV